MVVSIRQHADSLRRTMTIVAVASLILCLATISLWARSYWRTDTREIVTPADVRWFRSHRGAISYVNLNAKGAGKNIVKLLGPRRRAFTTPAQNVLTWQEIHKPQLGDNGLLGFWYVRAPDSFFVMEIPYWFLALTCAFAPLWWLRSPLRKIHRASGCCPQCGYDLRASRERCPECGFTLPRPLAPAIRLPRSSRLRV